MEVYRNPEMILISTPVPKKPGDSACRAAITGRIHKCSTPVVTTVAGTDVGKH